MAEGNLHAVLGFYLHDETTCPDGWPLGAAAADRLALCAQTDALILLNLTEFAMTFHDRVFPPGHPGAQRPLLVIDAADFCGAHQETKKALLVDDNLDLLDSLAEFFRLMGYEVLTASDAQSALDLLQQNEDVKVLLSDLVMPGMNGIQLGYEARKLLPDIKVILVSGYSGFVSAMDNSHDFDFLEKPYHLNKIEALINAPD